MAPAPAHFGHPAAVETASRTISLTPRPKYVRVHSGETVAFRAGSKTVAWTFWVDHVQGTSVDMSQIFPDLPEAKGVPVFIIPQRSRNYGR
nr:CzcE family metal-binding protein [Cupriavidus sp. SK-3]